MNLLDGVGALRRMVKYMLFRNRKAEAKQGPAEMVVPVFRPMKPSIFKSLLVLFHSTSLWLYYVLAVNLNRSQLTTSLKSSYSMHAQHTIATSLAVDHA